MICRRLSLLLVVVPLLAACGIFGGSDDEESAPAELIKFDSSIRVSRLWSVKLGDDAEHLLLGLRPATDGDVMYAAAHDGRIVALNLQTGERIWQVDTELPLSAGPGVGLGMLVVGSTDGDVVAFDSGNGESLWTIETSSEVLAAPAVGRDVVVFRTVDGRLHGVESGSGLQLWDVEREVPRLSLRGNSAPVIDGDLVLSGFDNGHILGVRLQTGETVWETVLRSSRGTTDLEKLADVDATITISGNAAFVVGYQAKAAMLDIDHGGIIWETDFSSHSGLGVDSNRVYAVTSQSEVVAMDRGNGVVLWRQSTMYNRELTGPAVFRDSVVMGDLEGYLHCLDKSTGEMSARVRVDNKAIVTAPVVVADIILVQSEGGTVAAYRVN